MEIREWICGGELNHGDLRPEFDILTQGSTEAASFTPSRLQKGTKILREGTDPMVVFVGSEMSLMGLNWADDHYSTGLGIFSLACYSTGPTHV